MIISFEGVDGCGKTTQAILLCEYLESVANVPCVLVREPGGTKISEDIRSVLLSKENTNMSLLTETYLFAASRAQVVHEVIRPALAENKVVICDRFYDSSAIYQGRVNGLGEETVWKIHREAVREVLPNVVIFLSMPEDLIESRLKLKSKDRIESKGIDYQIRVEKAYQERAKAYPLFWYTLDASKDRDSLAEEVRKIYYSIV